MTNAVNVTLKIDEALQVAAACPGLREYLVSRVRDTVGYRHGGDLWYAAVGLYAVPYYDMLTLNNCIDTVSNWACTSKQAQTIPVFDSLVESMGCLDSGLL